MQKGITLHDKLIPHIPDLTKRNNVSRVQVHLPLDLLEQIDQTRAKVRHDLPEMAARREFFVETAIRYFLDDYNDLVQT